MKDWSARPSFLPPPYLPTSIRLLSLRLPLHTSDAMVTSFQCRVPQCCSGALPESLLLTWSQYPPFWRWSGELWAKTLEYHGCRFHSRMELHLRIRARTIERWPRQLSCYLRVVVETYRWPGAEGAKVDVRSQFTACRLQSFLPALLPLPIPKRRRSGSGCHEVSGSSGRGRAAWRLASAGSVACGAIFWKVRCTHLSRGPER